MTRDDYLARDAGWQDDPVAVDHGAPRGQRPGDSGAGESPARFHQLLSAVGATRACALLFFPDLNSRALPYDETELSNTRACLGRLYFKIPGGITYGQHWLNVKFQNSLIRVPFRILTKDEEKFFSKNYKSIDQQVKDAFKPKKSERPRRDARRFAWYRPSTAR